MNDLDKVLQILSSIAIVLCFSLTIIFATSYAFFFNWRSTQAGRSILYLVVSMAALLGLAMFRVFWNQIEVFEVLRVLLYSSLIATLGHLLSVLWRSGSGDRSIVIENRTGPTNTIREKTMSAPVPQPVPSAGIPVIWYKNQRVLRTLLSGILGAIPVVVFILGSIAETWPVGWLTAAASAGLAIQLVITKIMTNPIVNAWLTRYTIFGSEPRHKI